MGTEGMTDLPHTREQMAALFAGNDSDAIGTHATATSGYYSGRVRYSLRQPGQ
jgi:hypothetical protein